MSILDLSKSLIYDFHYNYIKTKYGNNAKLLLSILTLSHMKLRPKIFTKISIPTLRNGLTLMITRLIIHLELKTGLNSKVLGMFKDEAGGKQIVLFVGLRSKLYSYKLLDALKIIKCKMMTKNVTKRSIQFDEYREFLFSRKEQHRKMNVIRSHCHDVYTE